MIPLAVKPLAMERIGHHFWPLGIPVRGTSNPDISTEYADHITCESFWICYREDQIKRMIDSQGYFAIYTPHLVSYESNS